MSWQGYANTYQLGQDAVLSITATKLGACLLLKHPQQLIDLRITVQT